MKIHIKLQNQDEQIINLEQVNTMLSQGELDGNEPAWTPGLSNWTRLDSIDGIILPKPPPFIEKSSSKTQVPADGMVKESTPKIRMSEPEQQNQQSVSADSKSMNSMKKFKSIVLVVAAIAGIVVAFYRVKAYYENRRDRAFELTREALDIIGNEKNTMWVTNRYNIRNEQDLKAIHVANNKIDTALNLYPNFSSYEIKGIILSRAGNLEDAILAFKKSIELNPEYGWAYSDLAGVYAKLGRNEEAIQNYKLALQTGSENPQIQRNYGLFLLKINKKAEAKKAFDQSKKLMKAWGLNLTFPPID